jgi:transketolase N-terminal domain/subunit
MSFEAAVHAQAIEIDRLSLEMCAAAGSGHPTSAMSIGHLVTVLMFHTMRWSPDYPDYPTSDRLVLSEGHAVPAVYAACAKLGVMVGKDPAKPPQADLDDLKTLRAMGTASSTGTPTRWKASPSSTPPRARSGRALGRGGPGRGRQARRVDRRIYCIIGDGESREGQIAEALDYIVDRKLQQRAADLQLQRVRPGRPRERAAVTRVDRGQAQRGRLRRQDHRRAQPQRRSRPPSTPSSPTPPSRRQADGGRREDGQGLGRALDPGQRLARQAADGRLAQEGAWRSSTRSASS